MMRNRYAFLALVASVIVLLDQGTKRWVVWFFENDDGRTKEIIPGVFDLILTHNPGAAWGMLGDLQPDALRIAVFVVISVAAVVMVLWLAQRARPDQRLLVGALSLVLGGALGNLIDRIAAGKVVDCLDFYTHAGWFMGLMERVGRPCSTVHGCHWPAFNVADICISTGVTLLILETFLTSRAEKRAARLAADRTTETGGFTQEPPANPS